MSRRLSTTPGLHPSNLLSQPDDGHEDDVPHLPAEAKGAPKTTSKCLGTYTTPTDRRHRFGRPTMVVVALSLVYLGTFPVRDAPETPLPSPITIDTVATVARGLTLVQSLVVHRHGDRTPITPLADTEYWASLLPTAETLARIGRYTNIVGTPGDEERRVVGKGDVFGRLTKVGLAQMVRVGGVLRDDVARLMESYKFGAGEDVDPNTWLKVASTDRSRTVQSVQGVLLGMLALEEDVSLRGAARPLIIDVDVRHTSKMVPDPQPRRYIGQVELEHELQLSDQFRQREQNMRPLAIRVTRELKKSGILGKEAEGAVSGVGEDRTATNKRPTNDGESPLPWNQLAEILKCLEKNKRLPKSLARDTDAVRAVADHNAWRWFALLSDSRLGPMAIKSLAKKMVKNGSEAVAAWKDGDGWLGIPLMHIFSAHDSTLISLICAFKIERPAVWPEYGSVLKMEIYHDYGKLCNDGVIDNCVMKNGRSSVGTFYALFYLNGEALRSSFGREEKSLRYFVPWEDVVEGMKELEEGLPLLVV